MRLHQQTKLTTLGSAHNLAPHRRRAMSDTRGISGIIHHVSGQIPAAVDAHRNTRARRSVYLPSSHGCQNRLTCIVGRPHCGQSRGTHAPTKGTPGIVRPAPRFPRGDRVSGHFAVKVMLLSRGQSCMRIGRANHAKLKGIQAYFFLQTKARSQSTTDVVPLFRNVVCPLSLDIIRIGFKITERIIG